MPWCRSVILLLVGFVLCGGSWPAMALPQEYVTTTPVLADGVLYVASSDYPGQRGHLRAIDIVETFPVTLWDAAERMPLAGIGNDPGDRAESDPPARIQRDNVYRSLFTNLEGAQRPLTAAEVQRLQPALGSASQAEAELLLHRVRGRRGGSLALPSGTADDPQRLWSISRSSPVLVGRSPVNTVTAQRDRVLYAGAADGMLHGFFVSRWQAGSNSYLVDDPDGGRELWAYLPGSFLPYLKDQPLDDALGELAVHLDGSPVVREVFLDLDGDGRRNWTTLLAATGTLVSSRRSCLFVMDVTDPYQPELLWEKLLPGDNVGRSRGVKLGDCGGASSAPVCLYLTADFTGESGGPALHALAMELTSGELLWQFTAPYAPSGAVAAATPAVPALMDLDNDGSSDTLVFGDLVGRLWALALADGRAYGDAPVYQVPGGVAEPIGAGVAVYGRLAAFGSGGVEGAADDYQYALYAVEILPEGSRLRWSYPLAAGEKVWEAPTIDASGKLFFGTAVSYLLPSLSGQRSTSGRVVALSRDGEEDLSRDLGAAAVGQVVLAPGLAIVVSVTGETTQFGSASRLTAPGGELGSVKILSWRER